MNTKRLFFGVELSGEARAAVRAAAEKMRLEKGKLTDADNYHVTLAFLGQTDENAVPELLRLGALCWRAPFTLALSGGIGAFKGGSVIWAGLDKSDALFDMQARLQAILRENGFPLEEGAYAPHITMARSARAVLPYPSVERVSFGVRAMTLFESTREGGRLVYKPLGRRPQ